MQSVIACARHPLTLAPSRAVSPMLIRIYVGISLDLQLYNYIPSISPGNRSS